MSHKYHKNAVSYLFKIPIFELSHLKKSDIMNQNKLAQFIREKRLNRAWSQAQLADICSVNIRTIQRLEQNGQCAHETLLAVATAFDLNINELTELSRKNTLFENIINEQGCSISVFNKEFHFKWLTPQSTFIAGLFLMFPALFFIFASIARHNFGLDLFYYPFELLLDNSNTRVIFNLLSPLIFLGGLVSAVILNLAEILSLSFYKKNSTFSSTLIFNLHKNNLFVAGLGLLGMVVMAGYALAENFVLR
jgi:transcriptional regulator with XRE-family HTH domain